MNYTEIPAGREMDRLIAEKVFGRDPMNAWHGLHENGDLEYCWEYPVGHDIAPPYSTNETAAASIVSHIYSQLFSRRYFFLRELQSPELRRVEGDGTTIEFAYWWIFVANRRLEICRAALRAQEAQR